MTTLAMDCSDNAKISKKFFCTYKSWILELDNNNLFSYDFLKSILINNCAVVGKGQTTRWLTTSVK